MRKILAILWLAAVGVAGAGTAAAAPLKLVIWGGTGMIGQRIVQEALSRGASVTVVVRDPNKHAPAANPKLTVVQGDILDAAQDAQLLAGANAAVCAVSFRGAGANPGDYRKAAEILAGALHGLGARAPHLIFVGGAGSLETKPGVLLADGMPDGSPFKAEVLGQKAALDYFRTRNDVPWTYFSPAGSIAPGARTGKFRLGGGQLVTDAQGKSSISAEDYAVAALDELEKPAHIHQRFTIGY